ncbi:RIKEN cDNA A230091H23, isoform CRA_b [Mus musculus]|nr:RIKEN cDNA A230091H23, isoform CRA_b [Mus musculus]
MKLSSLWSNAFVINVAIALYAETAFLSAPKLKTHQKRASDPIADAWEPPCGCWKLNSRPLEEQSVLLITEPSLQPK